MVTTLASLRIICFVLVEAFEFSRRVGDVIFLYIGYFIEVLSNTEGVSLRSANPCGSHSE
jgi:hypothetical protein